MGLFPEQLLVIERNATYNSIEILWFVQNSSMLAFSKNDRTVWKTPKEDAQTKGN